MRGVGALCEGREDDQGRKEARKKRRKGIKSKREVRKEEVDMK